MCIRDSCNSDLYSEKVNHYMDKVQRQLYDIIEGNKSAEEVFYAENQNLSPNDLLSTLPGKTETLRILTKLMRELIEKKEGKISILEVGTRDTETTEFLLESVKELGVEYTYIDSSAYFVNSMKTFKSRYPFFKAKVINIDSDNVDCLLYTSGGTERTLSEYCNLFQKAGLKFEMCRKIRSGETLSLIHI